MKAPIQYSQHFMHAISLILAPLLQAISTFFWIDGEYGITGGTLLFLSVIFWIPALIALFALVKEKMPNYAAWGLLVAIGGFVSGSNFAFLGFLSEAFHISHQAYINELANYPVSANLLLFQSGPLAPLSLIVLGIVLLITRSTSRLIALLIIFGGISFPLGRIFRTEWIAHLSDCLLLLPLVLISRQIFVAKKSM